MDDKTFDEALKNYRQVRKSDYMRIRTNRKEHELKTSNRLLGAGAITALDTNQVDSDAGFWEYFETGLKEVEGVSQGDINKLFSFLRTEHNKLAPKLNLSDLEKIAESLL
jgi:hypothetical protein